MNRILFLFGFFVLAASCAAQPQKYTVANAHSHNDYEQKTPFWLAYDQGFGSIEADVFLVDGNLPVAHNAADIKPENNLKRMYLDPLLQCITKNNGNVYPDKKKKLTLLIDCKTEGPGTVKAIIEQVKQYPQILKNKGIKIVITGNQPNKEALFTYPAFIWFDGDLTYQYTKKNLARVALFSANFRDYAQWNGAGVPDAASATALKQQINYAHGLGKPIRFWGAPDTVAAWKAFEKMGVDFINTDQISELAAFLK